MMRVARGLMTVATGLVVALSAASALAGPPGWDNPGRGRGHDHWDDRPDYRYDRRGPGVVRNNFV